MLTTFSMKLFLIITPISSSKAVKKMIMGVRKKHPNIDQIFFVLLLSWVKRHKNQTKNYYEKHDGCQQIEGT